MRLKGGLRRRYIGFQTMARPRRCSVRHEELENVIGFDENFQMREGDAAGGVAGVGELRVSITAMICCAIE
jgi:hypothetical protein